MKRYQWEPAAIWERVPWEQCRTAEWVHIKRWAWTSFFERIFLSLWHRNVAEVAAVMTSGSYRSCRLVTPDPIYASSYLSLSMLVFLHKSFLSCSMYFPKSLLCAVTSRKTLPWPYPVFLNLHLLIITSFMAPDVLFLYDFVYVCHSIGLPELGK